MGIRSAGKGGLLSPYIGFDFSIMCASYFDKIKKIIWYVRIVFNKQVQLTKSL